LDQLIDQYEQFPYLLDTKHKLYHNKHARTDAFHKIAEVLKERVPHITIEEVKNRNYEFAFAIQPRVCENKKGHS
jgi:hypothetical protein